MGRVLEESQVQDMKNIRNKQGKRGGAWDQRQVYRQLLTLIRLKETSLFLVKQKLPQRLFNFVFKCRIINDTLLPTKSLLVGNEPSFDTETSFLIIQ